MGQLIRCRNGKTPKGHHAHTAHHTHTNWLVTGKELWSYVASHVKAGRVATSHFYATHRCLSRPACRDGGGVCIRCVGRMHGMLSLMHTSIGHGIMGVAFPSQDWG